MLFYRSQEVKVIGLCKLYLFIVLDCKLFQGKFVQRYSGIGKMVRLGIDYNYYVFIMEWLYFLMKNYIVQLVNCIEFLLGVYSV